ncbi:Aste57867_2371 [Aphanomyces stellatus]|uniref:Aste57867_2371 protein n=1 Tax=Aphanomyces stellatus TaxID=120398 RepID=A0A485KBQ0_9STRA|nr:hypothetical protein As57867_002366 [Aphanomyces stellatus]VFT79572.1 Aste57867_2371 [Aphanomyces stellatus]
MIDKTPVPATEEEEAFQGPPEPVAPWNWSNIPDYGPLKHYQHALAFMVIGVAMTLVYEFSTYFDQIPRELAYPLIWVFIFLRMLGKLGPATLSEEEELAQKEEEEARAFKETLKKLEVESDDEEDEGNKADQGKHAKLAEKAKAKSIAKKTQ